MGVCDLETMNAKPLAWGENGELLAYSRGELFLVDSAGQRKDVCRLPLSGIRRCAARSNFASRLMRVEPRTAIICGEKALVAWLGGIYLVGLTCGNVSVIKTPEPGFSSPLYFTHGKSPEKYIAIWGDYGVNRYRDSVRIYAATDDGKIEQLYAFLPGQIRHVHGIVERRLGGFYVLTGDHEESSGIYVADSSFSDVRPLAVGHQNYRAVRGFAVDDGLVYATDSSITDNHIFYLSEADRKGSLFSLEDLGEMNGPCIYGGSVVGGYIFTTTVEPDESLSGFRTWVSTTIGRGVKSKEATAVFVGGSGTVSEIMRIPSDGLPFKLFQYGSLMMPSGNCPKGSEIAFARSLRSVDGRVVRLMRPICSD